MNRGILVAQEPNAIVETFISRWQNNAGGAERANYAMFLAELCDVIGVARPDPASHETEFNEYAFERGVTKRDGGERVGSGRIDLYKRGSFVLEAKQSRWKGGAKAVAGQTDMFSADSEPKLRSRADRSWDVLMMNARRQAEDYAKALRLGVVSEFNRIFPVVRDYPQPQQQNCSTLERD
jgi:hypothetical protein